LRILRWQQRRLPDNGFLHDRLANSGAPGMTQKDGDTLLSRLDRVESIQAIQQLAARYALAVDSRDLDSWVQLFVEDVNCGRHGIGRKVLREVIAAMFRNFYRSIHFVGNHQIDLIDANHATGVVYCRADHEVGDQWIVVPVAYFDEYERRGGTWYFVRRREKHWYSVDHLERPAAPFHRWPEDGKQARLPGDFSTWHEFWADSPPSVVAALTNAPVDPKPGVRDV
jgi:hypothetical protein